MAKKEPTAQEMADRFNAADLWDARRVVAWAMPAYQKTDPEFYQKLVDKFALLTAALHLKPSSEFIAMLDDGSPETEIE